MTRRLWRPVIVQVAGDSCAGEIGDAGPPPPHTFRWRGRLYRVQEVLARWAEAEAWWRDAGAAAAVPTVLPGADRWVWRVEAIDQRACSARAAREPHRIAGGVYDLAFAPASALWTVLRVID